jgi:23S rRNA G2445 N2-methylase RlmL
MSFDKDTRNLLARTVTACRRRLTEDVNDQLTGVFGLHPDGTVLSLKEMSHLSPDQVTAAGRLRDLLDHYTAGAAGGEKDRRKSAYERIMLEISFTILNRLAALRLCEERGLVVECVRKGTASDGFRLFERVSGGALGGRYDTYRVFLECLFDELALDLGVLFDRMTPQSFVFPTERCMEDVLGELNKPELSRLWTEDETIGWVYQYFNPPEERRAMRDASAAPRNSRELAVRNQFFTPRYVVEFLTDNTLGRIWYEMRKGDTAFKDECRYLVRRPNEVFLAAGEKAPPEAEGRTDLSQEELLKQSVYIEHRPKKDPRDLRVLDPACGSGHFLLYAFDRLERIFEEAWGDPESPESEATGRTLLEDFETLDDMRREIPKLILEHNLHGIDIDPRAVQIAALALWLRAQKAWKNLGIKAVKRPRVAKSNIVTAEPMPGEADMKEEFTAGLKPRILGQLVDTVFDKMKLAGEAGSLLKIEEEIKDVVSKAKEEYRKELRLRKEEAGYLPGMAPERAPTLFDFADMSDEDFLDQSEDAILAALKEYAERAENGRIVRHRLFAEDAARGFSFIDLCRKRYDAVLMNPPFGEFSAKTKSSVASFYGPAKNDIYGAFMTRALELLHSHSRFGAITSRTWLALSSFRKLREFLLLHSRPQIIADLGRDVLDDANVQVCAYAVEKP